MAVNRGVVLLEKFMRKLHEEKETYKRNNDLLAKLINAQVSVPLLYITYILIAIYKLKNNYYKIIFNYLLYYILSSWKTMINSKKKNTGNFFFFR